MVKTLNINEACKLAKNLTSYKDELTYMLAREEYLYNIKEEHLKKESNSEAENIEKNNIDLYPNKYDITADGILELIDKIMKTKAVLSKAIEEAKSKIFINVGDTELNLDSAIEYNKGLRRFIEILSRATIAAKNSVKEFKGQDYKFDNEGKQTPYYYTVKKTYEVNFNKDNAIKMRKELKALADKISIDIDKAKLNAVIEIDTEFDLHDTLEDIINAYIAENKNK